jgi:hypothetical protein
LRERDVADVRRPSGRPETVAEGPAREWAQLMVSLAGNLPPSVAALRGWLGRHPGTCITLEIDCERLTTSDASARAARADDDLDGARWAVNASRCWSARTPTRILG